MRKIALSIAVFGTILLPVLCTVPAHAQATRTWVSVTTPIRAAERLRA